MRVKLAVIITLLVAVLCANFMFAAEPEDIDVSALTPDELMGLDDATFIYSFIRAFSTEDPDILIDFYYSTDNNNIRLMIVSALGQDGVRSGAGERAVNLACRALREGDLVREVNELDQYSQAWEIRMTAANILGIMFAETSPSEYEDPQVRAVIEALIFTMDNDNDELVRGSAALALGSILKGTGSDPTVQEVNHYIDRIIYSFERVTNAYQYEAACMAAALGLTDHPRAFLPLLEARTRGFNANVQRQIIESLQNILE